MSSRLCVIIVAQVVLLLLTTAATAGPAFAFSTDVTDQDIKECGIRLWRVLKGLDIEPTRPDVTYYEDHPSVFIMGKHPEVSVAGVCVGSSKGGSRVFVFVTRVRGAERAVQIAETILDRTIKRSP